MARSVEMTILVKRLVDLCEPITRACCRAYRLTEDQADDLVCDTFLAAYRNLPKCREHSRLSSWLRTIARRQIIDQLRRQSERERREAVERSRQSYAYTQNPTTLSQSWELHMKLHAGIQALPKTWMTILRLYYWQCKNTHEIATHLQIEPSTIRVILHRSRQRLRRELEGMYAA